MKTKTLLFLFLLISGIMSAQVKRVAILETVDRENKVSYGNKLILRANLSKAITNTAGYEAYDRTDIDAIMGEQNFQRTGLVSNDQIKKLGEMTGANYILVAEAAVVDANNMFITAKLLDVETARTIMTDNVMMAANPEAIQAGCVSLAKKLFGSTEKPTSTNLPKPTELETTPTKETAPTIAATTTNVIVRNSKSTQKQLGVKKYTYGSVQLDEKELREFLYKNNTLAYAEYMKGAKMITTGWWLLGGGMFAIVAGTGMGGVFGGGGGAAMIISLSVIGSAAVAGSVPLVLIGNNKQKKSFDLNNYSLEPNQPKLSLNLQTSQNGIGLALSF